MKTKPKPILGTKFDRANQKMLCDMIKTIAKQKKKNGEDYNAGMAHCALVWFFDDLCATIDWLFLHMSFDDLAVKYGRSPLSIEESIQCLVLPVGEWLTKSGELAKWWKEGYYKPGSIR
jgi:hypothetical protein